MGLKFPISITPVISGMLNVLSLHVIKKMIITVNSMMHVLVDMILSRLLAIFKKENADLVMEKLPVQKPLRKLLNIHVHMPATRLHFVTATVKTAGP